MNLEDEIHAIRTQIAAQNRETQSLKTRLQAQNIALCLLAPLCLTFAALPPAGAQIGVTLGSLNTRLFSVENKTASISALTDPNTGQPTVRFSNVNVQIVSGTGFSTLDDLVANNNRANGRGNLILGYNERRGSEENLRTGSYCLILGDENNYTHGGGIVAGNHNESTNFFAAVLGGQRNASTNYFASVLGGQFNTASGTYSSVLGGFQNTASGKYSGVAGGIGNTASGTYQRIP